MGGAARQYWSAIDALKLEPISPSGTTMSSREIAELTGKRRDNVIRDIKAMLADLSFEVTDFEGSYIDQTGRSLPCFSLPSERH